MATSERLLLGHAYSGEDDGSRCDVYVGQKYREYCDEKRAAHYAAEPAAPNKVIGCREPGCGYQAGHAEPHGVPLDRAARAAAKLNP